MKSITCSIEGCFERHHAKRFCYKHYIRFWRYGDPTRVLRQQIITRPEHHGLKNTTEYNIWANMIARCSNPKYTGYKYWGGRGIKVCERWRQSFVDFLADMGHRPSLQHTLDRQDVEGSYSPANCRWATWREQQNNRTNNKWLEHGGLRMTQAQWARHLDVKPQTIYSRLKRGWPIEKALVP